MRDWQGRQPKPLEQSPKAKIALTTANPELRKSYKEQLNKNLKNQRKKENGAELLSKLSLRRAQHKGPSYFIVNGEAQYCKGQWIAGLEDFLRAKFAEPANPRHSQQQRANEFAQRAKVSPDYVLWQMRTRRLALRHFMRAIAGARLESTGAESKTVWEHLKLLPLESRMGLLRVFQAALLDPAMRRPEDWSKNLLGVSAQGIQLHQF